MFATLVLNRSEEILSLRIKINLVIPNRAEGSVRNLLLFSNGANAAKISE